jgi:putative thioredoxin
MPDLAENPSSWVVETTDDAFERDVIERSREVPVVVDFWADWCQPCRLLGPLLESLAAEYQGQFILVKANTDRAAVSAGRFGVQAIPAVFGVRNEKVVDFFAGILPEQHLRQWLERLLPTESERLLAEGNRAAESDPQAAEALFRRAIECEERTAAPRIALAELLVGLNRFDEAAQLVDALEKRGYLEPEAERVKSAVRIQQQGEATGGVEACRKALELDPRSMVKKLQLAEALAAEQLHAEALQRALEVVEQDRGELREAARVLMVEIFQILPDDSQLVHDFRRKLAAALY